MYVLDGKLLEDILDIGQFKKFIHWKQQLIIGIR